MGMRLHNRTYALLSTHTYTSLQVRVAFVLRSCTSAPPPLLPLLTRLDRVAQHLVERSQQLIHRIVLGALLLHLRGRHLHEARGQSGHGQGMVRAWWVPSG